MFRELRAAPERLVITAWGRRFSVVPSEKVRAAAACGGTVEVDVVGPSAALLQPLRPDDVVHIDATEDGSEDVTEVLEPPSDILELVYESDDDITVVNGDVARSADKLAMGARHGA
jgi:hypothetical protein